MSLVKDVSHSLTPTARLLATLAHDLVKIEPFAHPKLPLLVGLLVPCQMDEHEATLSGLSKSNVIHLNGRGLRRPNPPLGLDKPPKAPLEES